MTARHVVPAPPSRAAGLLCGMSALWGHALWVAFSGLCPERRPSLRTSL